MKRDFREVERHEFVDDGYDRPWMAVNPDGEYVWYTDYQELLNEIDRLREELKEWKMSEKETRHCMVMEYKKLKKELDTWKEVAQSRDSFINSLNEQIIRLQEENKESK